MLDVAVAFITFNRPEPTAKSFARIRAARPTRLILISDAPRNDQSGEADLVDRTREIIEQIDWDCDVDRIYAESNMGCGLRISSGITEAFERVDRLIVLEDDCVADDSFFGYCQTMLDYYEDDERISTISGDNFQKGISRTDASYYFSKYMHCWGWATWRRAWKNFSLEIPQWPEYRDSGSLATWCQHQLELEYWTRMFNRCHRGELNTWDFPWQLTCWMNHGLTVLPDVNLVTNIGFGSDATHTHTGAADASLPTQAIGAIRHPQYVYRNHAADTFTDQLFYSQPSTRNTIKRLRRKIGLTSRAA